MHRAWLPLLGLSASLAGCSISMTGDIPGTHGHASQYHIVSTPSFGHAPLAVAAAVPPVAKPVSAPETTVIDVPALYRTVLRVPSLVGSLGRDLMACTGLIAVIGLLNAILLVRLPKTMSSSLEEKVVTRVSASISSALNTTRLETATSVSPPTPPRALRASSGRACTCGVAISERSRTGKCRRCAQIVRLEQLRLPRTISNPMLARTTDDDGNGWEQGSTAIVSHARLGERRQYYTFDFTPQSERGPVFIELFADALDEKTVVPIDAYEEQSALR